MKACFAYFNESINCMKKILTASQKGGSGKTTLTANLGVEAERGGENVRYIDTDRQATLSLWHRARQSETPERFDVSVDRIEEGFSKITGEGATYCFIDTAPTLSKDNERLISLADLVLIPVRPSPFDLWSAGETVELVRAAGKPFLFVLTEVKLQANITAQTAAALSQHGRVAQAFIGSRVVYAASMKAGLTASEVSPRSPAAQEISALWQEVKAFFDESGKASFHENKQGRIANG
jgi:chromosome partitioning protein